MKKERISITIPNQAHNSKSKIYSAFTCELKGEEERMRWGGFVKHNAS